MTTESLPAWAEAILRCPAQAVPLQVAGRDLVRPDGTRAGRTEAGIARFPILADTDGVTHYRAIGGAHFHERRHVAFSMSALDTPVYRAHIDRFRGDPHGLVVDIGGGDGRNTVPFLEAGHRRVVVVDAAGDALVRFRQRLAETQPAWLERVLLVEADARALPLATGSAARVLAIEALYYLNEDYRAGLREAKRLLREDGRLLLSERDYEGGLVMRAIYFGLAAMLRSASSGDLWEGDDAAPVRTRSFTERQLVDMLAEEGLSVCSVEGTPLLALILGWLRSEGKLGEADEALRPEVQALFERLARQGSLRRCHVVVAGLSEPG